jgi:hypothetical protein
MVVGLSAPAEGASPSPDASPTVFVSSSMPYTITLPPGWTVLPSDPNELIDVFLNGDISANVNSRGEAPQGQTVAQRVELRRAEAITEGCSSDPADDEDLTLGGEPAILWTRTCPGWFSATVATIHAGNGYAMSVDAPLDMQPQVRPIVYALVPTFAFTDPSIDASAPPDLGSIDAQLQGTWQTDWRSPDLDLATIRAAGLDPDSNPAWIRQLAAVDTLRTAVTFVEGVMTEYEAVNGGSLGVGWRGRYRLVDADSIEAVEIPTRNTIVYDFTIRDYVLVLDVVSDGAADDLIPQTAIYETLPFTKVP